MKLTVSISAAIALAALGYTPSLADCPDVTGSVNKQEHSGIAKDGTHVPLEGTANSQTKTETSTGTTTTSADALPKTPQKDGSNMPLGENSNLATSDQDVSAQQKGDQTAAVQDKCK